MNKQNILALALKPAMRVTKSVGIGIVLMLVAALIAMITPSAASGRRPCQGPTATLLVTGLHTGLESAKGSTAGPYVGRSVAAGIYRLGCSDSFTVVADIGDFNLATPPPPPFVVPTGLQYALQTYRAGFLVTDGHLNRVLRVTLDGEVTVLIAFD